MTTPRHVFSLMVVCAAAFMLGCAGTHRSIAYPDVQPREQRDDADSLPVAMTEDELTGRFGTPANSWSSSESPGTVLRLYEISLPPARKSACGPIFLALSLAFPPALVVTVPYCVVDVIAVSIHNIHADLARTPVDFYLLLDQSGDSQLVTASAVRYFPLEDLRNRRDRDGSGNLLVPSTVGELHWNSTNRDYPATLPTDLRSIMLSGSSPDASTIAARPTR